MRRAPLALLLLGCRASLPVAPEGEAALVATPARVALAVLRGRGPAHASLTVRAGRAVELLAVTVEGSALFQVLPLALPAALRAQEELPVGLILSAPPGTAPGVHRARLVLRAEGVRAVDLVALVVDDGGPEREPPLQDVISALGLGARVGSAAFALGMAPAPLGEEVTGGWFRRAGPGPVSLTPVAAFTSRTSHAFGFSRGPLVRPCGTLDWDQNQTLDPTFDGGQQTVSFDPGPEPFALWVERAGIRYHSADALNASSAHHARIYPVRDAAGAAVPDRWLVALEESDDGDYQDLLLLVSNAAISGPPQ